jgi:RNA polymerase sigma factor (sigma-70 family)
MLDSGHAAVSDRVAKFNGLFARHNQAVLGYLVRRTDQVADAADLLAEVFLVAWTKIEKVPHGEEERLWLFGVARNTVRNYKRSGLRRNALADQLRQHIVSAGEFDSSIGPEVRQALMDLSDNEREILMMTAWDGLSPTEAAKLMHVPANRIRVRLHRAKRKLAERLGLLSESLAIEPHRLSEERAQ